MAHPNANRLIVEGTDDLYSVVELMRLHIGWPPKKEDAPVEIKAAQGVDRILEQKYLLQEIKTPGLRSLGVIVDADADLQSRYDSIRGCCLPLLPALPRKVPAEGLILEAEVNEEQRRFGVWIMPDNASTGSIETFLRFLVPPESAALWDLSVRSVTSAQNMGARCDTDKANLYTWLAWQDPPGQSPGSALIRRVLISQGAVATAFVTWFRNLYGL